MIRSRGTLKRDGYAWIRLWSGGPGVYVARGMHNHPCAFSIRQGLKRCVQVRGYVVTLILGDSV